MHIKQYIVHTYTILATQTINIFTTVYLIILPKSQMHPRDYIIISQNKQDNSRLCPPKIYYRHCYKTLPHLTINTTSSKQLTPQADQKPEQYRSGHDWYSKFIKLET